MQTKLKNTQSPLFLIGIDLGTKFVGFSKGSLKDKTTEVPKFFKYYA